jgi:hypothetical protein
MSEVTQAKHDAKQINNLLDAYAKTYPIQMYQTYWTILTQQVSGHMHKLIEPGPKK